MEGKWISLVTNNAVEYWRNQYQRMNKERFFAANAIALITHTIVSNHHIILQTQPLDLVKTRTQLLQEGKGFTGIGFRRGLHSI